MKSLYDAEGGRPSDADTTHGLAGGGRADAKQEDTSSGLTAGSGLDLRTAQKKG